MTCSDQTKHLVTWKWMKRHWNSAMGEEPCKNLKARTRSLITCRRKFRSQTSDNMDRWKSRSEKRREEKKRKRKSQKKEYAGARKGRKVARHSVFPMVCGSGGSKSRLAKAAGAEPAGQMRDEQLHAVEARSTFRSQNVQNTSCSEHFVARSTFRSQKCKKLMGSDHFGSWDV